MKGKVKVKVSGGQELEAEQALVAAGFRPNTKDLGLESVGVRLSDRGFVEIDDRMALVGGEHDLDSLDILLVITRIEKEFGIKIADRAVGRRAFTDVATLADFVEAQRA